jgi:hypothetical protein
LSGVELSPQFTVNELTVPSGSVPENVAVTVDVVLAGLGAMLLSVTIGGRSFTVSVVVPEPGPALLAAVTVIVKVCDLAKPELA